MYKKYSFVGKEQKTDFVHDGFVFSLWALSNSTNIATEVLVYPWTSLVAEFGGTLGMKLDRLVSVGRGPPRAIRPNQGFLCLYRQCEWFS